jgi:UDP-N-acetylmuramate: L-alanyl-gamma-D-glutamyl-meso-diaminopimelate ligase
MHLKKQKIHFIAIGGSVMHNLAVELHKAGHQVTGSDDEIADPSRSVLQAEGILPPKEGWFPEKVSRDLDFVIVGMHARKDNPELVRAQELQIRVLSFPDYIYEQSKDKQRIVIAGSHGKTTITAIIIHVLKFLNRKFDYVVGARVPGVPTTVKITDAPLIIIEGDEYLSSPLDPTPKFLRYRHHVGIISGIAWDHANVYPTEEEYVRQFDHFADQTPKGGILIFNEQDPIAAIVGKKERPDTQEVPFKSHSNTTDSEGNLFLTNGKERFPIKIFGTHNLQNINAAKELLKKLGVSSEQFFEAIPSFAGASGRLEKVKAGAAAAVFKDFAHAPSKVKATVKAMKETYPSRDLIACLELHTFSSLNKKFLPQYRDSLKGVQTQVVYFDPAKVSARGFDPLSEGEIKTAFNAPALKVFDDSRQLYKFLAEQPLKNKNLLMMSSGNFGGLDLGALSDEVIRA